jgi:LemA protein
VEEHWGVMDSLLKRRRDLIPNLIEISKNYIKAEEGVFDKIREQRSQCTKAVNLVERSIAERKLFETLIEFFAITENYPELMLNSNFIELKTKFFQIEDQIQTMHKHYNRSVKHLNNMIKTFPCNLIANASHFHRVAYFELENMKESA